MALEASTASPKSTSCLLVKETLCPVVRQVALIASSIRLRSLSLTPAGRYPLIFSSIYWARVSYAWEVQG
jgi:hypothetical protein